jgi:hypothetical protein
MLTPEVLEQSWIPHEAKGTAWLSAYLPLRPMISMR